MTSLFSTIHPDSFGYQLAFIRDTLAGLTQSELAEKINQAVRDNARVNRTHVKNWESNRDLEQVTPGILLAIVTAVGSQKHYDEAEQNKMMSQLKGALEETKHSVAKHFSQEQGVSKNFGEMLTQLREEALGATQSEFASLLQPLVNEPIGLLKSQFAFQDILDIEHGRVPPKGFVEAALEVFRTLGVQTETLNALRERGKQCSKSPDELRYLANCNFDSLRARAGHILLTGGAGPIISNPGRRPHFLAPASSVRRSWRDIEKGAGVPAHLLVAFFSEGRIDTFGANHRTALREYLLQESVPAEEVQEFEAILQEVNIRKVATSHQRSVRHTR